MARTLILVPPSLSTWTVTGRPVPEHLLALCARAGLEGRVVQDDAVAGPGPVLVVDGRWAAIRSATLGRLESTLSEGGGTLLSAAGEVVGVARLEEQDRPLLALLEHDGGATVRLDDDESLALDDLSDLAAVELVVLRRRLVALARTGVRVLDPTSVWVEPEVEVEPGAVLWPRVVLRGRTRVSSGAEIQSGAWLEDTEVGEGALIRPYSVCSGARIGPGASVGPMAHLRSGAILERDVRVGNFVEVKKTRLGEGAKASHLSYLGDAEVGAAANVGAGTITCNYDGHRKNRTRIGPRAFIGSNTALVAPIDIGEGAIVGAGSTLTVDVPADGLALERAVQRVLPGKAPLIHARNRRLREEEG